MDRDDVLAILTIILIPVIIIVATVMITIHVTDNNRIIKEAENPQTPAWRLEQLADDARAREAVAGNPNTPADTLDRLVDIEDSLPSGTSITNANEIIEAVAGNPGTHEDTLRRLMKRYNDYHDILLILALNPHTPTDVLEELLDSRYQDVRIEAMINLQKRQSH
jgi:hypothetical protein